jgi:hypothetical protein
VPFQELVGSEREARGKWNGRKIVSNLSNLALDALSDLLNTPNE